jgi:hypothetical protein
MSKPVSIQHVFDEVVAQIEGLTRPSTKVEDDAAVAKLQELAADLQKSHAAAAEHIGLIAHFPQAQDGWGAPQRHNLGRYVKDRLPRLREALALPRTNVADLIWRSAELLRGAFREPEYRRVILPFTVLRRLDCLLQPTKSAVVTKHSEISTKGYDLRMFLAPITGYPFWNHSPFTLKVLTDAPDSLRDNLDAMVNGFSPNVRKIFEKFSFMATVDKLQEKGRLFHIVQAFARMAGYKLKNKTEHYLSLAGGEAKTLDPMAAGGGLAWDDPKLRLSTIILKMNEIFAGKHSDAEIEGWATAVVGNASEDSDLAEQAKANSTAGQFANGD